MERHDICLSQKFVETEKWWKVRRILEIRIMHNDASSQRLERRCQASRDPPVAHEAHGHR